MNRLPRAEDHRKPDYPIEAIFYRRWSPRALSGEPITDDELFTIFEAARWAPSTYNEQEWRFLYARRDTKEWPSFFELLTEGNQSWCQRAAVLTVVLARKTFKRNGKPNPVHLFDVGSAWQNAALQATTMGIVSHGMAGFDFAKARTALNVPEVFDVAAMFTLGRPGDPEQLPPNYRALDTEPKARDRRKHVRRCI